MRLRLHFAPKLLLCVILSVHTENQRLEPETGTGDWNFGEPELWGLGRTNSGTSCFLQDSQRQTGHPPTPHQICSQSQ